MVTELLKGNRLKAQTICPSTCLGTISFYRCTDVQIN